MLQCVDNVLDAGENEVIGRCERHGKLGRKPSQRVAYTGGAGVPHPHRIASIRVERWAGIPTISAVWRPRGPFARTRRSQWRAIEIVVAVHLSMVREFWIDSRSAHQVECEFGLWQKFVPQMQREIFVNTA